MCGGIGYILAQSQCEKCGIWSIGKGKHFCIAAWPQEQGREAIVTDSERAADQMRQDILGGKIDKAGRQVVRDACDKMDAPKKGRDASNDALGNISRRGGW